MKKVMTANLRNLEKKNEHIFEKYLPIEENPFLNNLSGELIQCVKYWSHEVSLTELQSHYLSTFFLSFNVIFYS